jgi:hypothetical protein
MNSDFVNATHSEAVQLPVRLQTGEYSLYAGTAIKDILPLSILWIGFDSPFVRFSEQNGRRLGGNWPPCRRKLATVSEEIGRAVKSPG